MSVEITDEMVAAALRAYYAVWTKGIRGAMASAINLVAPLIVDQAVRDERERCKLLAKGEPYNRHYRRWPFYNVMGGCSSNESAEAKIADAIAEAIANPVSETEVEGK